MSHLRAVVREYLVHYHEERNRQGLGGLLILSPANLNRPGPIVCRERLGWTPALLRLAPTVHSSLDRHAFVSSLITMARKNGFAAYIGDGANRWPAVHTLDGARLYRLALEAAPAGSRFHGAAEQGIAFRDIAEPSAAASVYRLSASRIR